MTFFEKHRSAQELEVYDRLHPYQDLRDVNPNSPTFGDLLMSWAASFLTLHHGYVVFICFDMF